MNSYFSWSAACTFSLLRKLAMSVRNGSSLGRIGGAGTLVPGSALSQSVIAECLNARQLNPASHLVLRRYVCMYVCHA